MNVQSTTMREARLHFLKISRAYLRGEMAADDAESMASGLPGQAGCSEAGRRSEGGDAD